MSAKNKKPAQRPTPKKKDFVAEANISEPLNFSFSSLKESVWFYPLAASFLLIILFAARLIGNFDIGFHLAAGRWIVENFSVPHTDIFTYTVSANEYIDIQWLYQVINYLVQSAAGYAGLTVFNVLLICSIFFLLFKRLAKAGVPHYLTVILLYAAAIAIQIRFSYRPEVFTWLFIMIIIDVMEKYFEDKKSGLILLPVIMLLWVNIHGLFILGLGIIGAYNISILIRGKKIDLRLLMFSAASAVAVFINPYLAKGAMFPLTLFTRLQEGNIFRKTITELKSPAELLLMPGLETPLYMFYAIAIIGALMLVITIKKRNAHQIIIFAAFLYISYSSYRNIPIFILYAVYIIGICFAEILRGRKIQRAGEKLNPYKKYFAWAMVIVVLLTGARVITGAYYLKNDSALKFGAGLDKAMLPDKAADFLAKKRSEGRIVNTLAYGGWIEWKLKQPVFIDGRLEVIGESFYEKYLSGLKTGGITALVNEYKARTVFSDPETGTWNKELATSVDWRMEYMDNNTVIFTRDSSYSKYFNTDEILTAAGINKNNFSRDAVKKMFAEAHLYTFADYIRGFYSSRYFASDLKKTGNFAFDLGAYDLSVFFYLETIRLSGGVMSMENYRELFLNLGMLYDMNRDFEFAAICFDKYLEAEPGDSAVRNRSGELKKLVK